MQVDQIEGVLLYTASIDVVFEPKFSKIEGGIALAILGTAGNFSTNAFADRGKVPTALWRSRKVNGTVTLDVLDDVANIRHFAVDGVIGIQHRKGFAVVPAMQILDRIGDDTFGTFLEDHSYTTITPGLWGRSVNGKVPFWTADGGFGIVNLENCALDTFETKAKVGPTLPVLAGNGSWVMFNKDGSTPSSGKSLDMLGIDIGSAFGKAFLVTRSARRPTQIGPAPA